MKRYYSHYTFIYPGIYFKNHVVEMDAEGHIVRCFPFEKETERTEFYSGLLAFVPEDRTDRIKEILQDVKVAVDIVNDCADNCCIRPDISFKPYHKENV
ncbi:MAG: hypothetical protein LBR26_11030 [Prevotella sp.]|jgi:hypothetical protein|nr:hypothetical protein [Prevotella sp.]